MTTFSRRMPWPFRFVLFAAGWTVTGLFARTALPPSMESNVLEPGNIIERSLAGGQVHDYEFVIQTGQYVKVVVEQHTIDVAIT
jgi:hypothetical protein